MEKNKEEKKQEGTLGVKVPNDNLSFDMTLRATDSDEGFSDEGREIVTIIKHKIGIKELQYLIKNIENIVTNLDLEATAELQGKDKKFNQEFKIRT